MSKRNARTTVASFRTGSLKHGWCCASCHKTFAHDGHPRRTFARFIAHRAGRHGHLFVAPLGKSCVVTRETADGGWVRMTWNFDVKDDTSGGAA